jgi:hypothetical protein
MGACLPTTPSTETTEVRQPVSCSAPAARLAAHQRAAPSLWFRNEDGEYFEAAETRHASQRGFERPLSRAAAGTGLAKASRGSSGEGILRVIQTRVSSRLTGFRTSPVGTRTLGRSWPTGDDILLRKAASGGELT